MSKPSEFTFTADLWRYPGNGGWHFITLPQPVAQEIDFYYLHEKKGWGSLRVEIHCREVVWETSIFTDKKSNSYLLPVKKDVRTKLGISAGDTVDLLLKII